MGFWIPWTLSLNNVMTENELNNARQYAVRQAWKNERELVKQGMGSRDWTPTEQREIHMKGSVSGYEGHHMKSVSTHPQYAADPNNIQFLSFDEHRDGAHDGKTRTNPTNGYYNPQTGKMHGFENRPPSLPKPKPLSEPLAVRHQNNATKAVIQAKQNNNQPQGGSNMSIGQLKAAIQNAEKSIDNQIGAINTYVNQNKTLIQRTHTVLKDSANPAAHKAVTQIKATIDHLKKTQSNLQEAKRELENFRKKI